MAEGQATPRTISNEIEKNMGNNFFNPDYNLITILITRSNSILNLFYLKSNSNSSFDL